MWYFVRGMFIPHILLVTKPVVNMSLLSVVLQFMEMTPVSLFISIVFFDVRGSICQLIVFNPQECTTTAVMKVSHSAYLCMIMLHNYTQLAQALLPPPQCFTLLGNNDYYIMHKLACWGCYTEIISPLSSSLFSSLLRIALPPSQSQWGVWKRTWAMIQGWQGSCSL